MKGAGGTSGGFSHFFIGIIMMCGGFYMLLNAITVTSSLVWVCAYMAFPPWVAITM